MKGEKEDIPISKVSSKEKEDIQTSKVSSKRMRIYYAYAFFIFFLSEVLIALYIHDSFIRSYMGDMLVVIVLYCFVRIFVPNKCRLLPLYLFLFAFMVECLQSINVVKLLGLEENSFFRVLIGSTFDLKDIICYGVGCAFLGLYEWKLYKNT